MAYNNILEEELKNKIAKDYFAGFDCTQINGRVDFCVSLPKVQPVLIETPALLWAEAKKGKADTYKSFVQLILTIGKERTFDKFLPPPFLAAFDAEKIAFLPYSEIQDVFYQNDFNWNVAPSNHQSKEFLLLFEKITACLQTQTLCFGYEKDEAELRSFIKNNFIVGNAELNKTQIDKNNFIVIYNKWLAKVKPTIAVNWEAAQKVGIIDADFYLADLLSQENETLKDKLYVVLKTNQYELDRKLDDMGMFNSRKATFGDSQKAHTQFWNRYVRPPRQEYWEYIVARRDLLVPQDVRERKGSYFTPQIWVELSQKYLTDVLGEDWQVDYYIWDCAAGTGNLLNGLSNKYNVWASTLDTQDVDVMRDRIKNGANLLEKHVFQFDFLNDDFNKLPQSLQDIINSPEKRKKLLIYINPPYAEAPQRQFQRLGKIAVEQSKINEKYTNVLGQGNRELFAQFLTRIYFEIPDCRIAQFSTLKILNGSHFAEFRNFFKAHLQKGFICSSANFDNVKGKFSIGFMIWDCSQKIAIKANQFDIYDAEAVQIGSKNYISLDEGQYINDWIKPFRADVAKNQLIGKFPFMGNDFQQQNIIQISHHKMVYNKAAGQFFINQKNILYAALYFAVRKAIPACWINDRDQFFYPIDGWQNDTNFQNDCLAYTLFSNNVQAQFGTNHWIPFTEKELNAREKMESNFMSKYIKGQIDTEISFDLFHKVEKTTQMPLVFSAQAQAVFDAGLAIWRYYHQQPDSNVNAALYDIKAYFQGRNAAGRMNNKSKDPTYNQHIALLRMALSILGSKIAEKVYQYRFLIK